MAKNSQKKKKPPASSTNPPPAATSKTATTNSTPTLSQQHTPPPPQPQPNQPPKKAPSLLPPPPPPPTSLPPRPPSPLNSHRPIPMGWQTNDGFHHHYGRIPNASLLRNHAKPVPAPRSHRGWAHCAHLIDHKKELARAELIARLRARDGHYVASVRQLEHANPPWRRPLVYGDEADEEFNVHNVWLQLRPFRTAKRTVTMVLLQWRDLGAGSHLWDGARRPDGLCPPVPPRT
ncbi:hypothetical protein B0T22DRAFT_113443 [Podospora appendiculata]|uniref:Uncharacterized protein n=1 Tax=Podospora appendiculata TaxID=314037 RepID=A0AAE0XLH2_9PEZI|nr:hypothetical protein B0T22DRAFT_113443 [Podospora appendiculata]